MKQIISGKRYDTTQATEIGSCSNGRSLRDFRVLNEWLFKTENGAYFLYGEGGAMTDYRVPDGDGWTNGERITPYSRTEAFEWAQERLSGEIVEEEFADLIKNA